LTLWLYAVVAAKPRRRLGRGISGETLRPISASRGRLHAVVGEGPRADLTRAALEGHAKVVARLAAAVDALLPARFGSVLDRSRLETLLDQEADALLSALERVRGREQMTVRVYARPRPQSRPRAPAGAGRGARYLAARLRAVDTDREASLAALRRAVAPLVRDERTVLHDEPPLVASVYHLIDRGRSRAYRARLKTARLPVRASGPWAPYAFAPERWA